MMLITNEPQLVALHLISQIEKPEVFSHLTNCQIYDLYLILGTTTICVIFSSFVL